MFDIGSSELLLIGIVALIVVGPKDLPKMFRALGQFTAKARSMARDFQRAMENAADEAGMKDVASDLKTLTSARNLGLDTVKDMAKDSVLKWDANKRGLTGDDAAEKTPPAEHGPATAELAAKVKAKTAAAEAMAADFAAGRAQPAETPAAGPAPDATVKPPRKTRARVSGPTGAAPAAAPKPPKAPARARRAPAAEAPAAVTAPSKPRAKAPRAAAASTDAPAKATKSKAKPVKAAGAEAAATTTRARKPARKTDA